MKKKKISLILLFGLSFITYSMNVNSQENGCTTFSLIENDHKIFGRNLDTDCEFGYIFINKRDMSKVAYFDSSSTEIAASWISKYGSITFNQISCDIPQGGINEQGLVVEHMYYGSSDYPVADSRPAVVSHQWIQYVLDNCLNVAEVLATNAAIRISDTEYKFPIHFHIMDITGDRAIIEFLSGTYTVYRGINYSACALANSSYTYSLNYLSNYIGWGGSTPIPTNVSSSPDRFVKAADMVKNYPGSGATPIIEYGFSVLDSVWDNTKWQLVYDLDNLSIYYRLLSDRSIKIIRLNDYVFDCLSGTKMLEIGDDPDNSFNWLNYSTTLNTNLINTSCSLSGFINSILGNEADDIAVHPENTSSCNATSGTDVQTACDEFTWIDGLTYTSSNNTATYILTNDAGFDSLVTLDLTVYYSTSGTDVQTACGSYIWIDGLTYTSSNNTASYTLTNAVGCDSIVTLNLTVNPLPSITTTTDGSRYGTGTIDLVATSSAGTINWYDVPTGGLSLWTGTHFTTPVISSTTTYYVDATDNGCTTETRTPITATINTPPSIPDELSVADTIVSDGESPCFNAYDIITVAGGSTTVEFLSGSIVDLIAEQSIIFLPGFHAYEGSLTHAYITINGTFCYGASGSSIVEQPVEMNFKVQKIPEKQPVVPEEKSIKVYPNPNKGQFTLELTNIKSSATIYIYNLIGAKVFQSSAINLTGRKMNLPDIRKGIYFVKVMDGREQFTKKMVVN